MLTTALVGTGTGILLNQLPNRADAPTKPTKNKQHSSGNPNNPPLSVIVKEQPTQAAAAKEKIPLPQQPKTLEITTVPTIKQAKQSTPKAPLSIQSSQKSSLTIQSSVEQKSSIISSLYSSLQNNAVQNSILFYNALKSPSKNIPTLNMQTMHHELTTIANNYNTVVYLSSEIVQRVITQMGFAQTPQLEEQWTITTPIGSVSIDFLSEKIASITIPTHLLTFKTTPQVLQPLAIQKIDSSFSADQLPTVVFSLPVQKTTVLPMESKNIVAVKPAQIEKLLTQFFFELLEKGKEKEKKKSAAKQKISPAMINIVGLPTISGFPEPSVNQFLPYKTKSVRTTPFVPKLPLKNKSKKEFSTPPQITPHGFSQSPRNTPGNVPSSRVPNTGNIVRGLRKQ